MWTHATLFNPDATPHLRPRFLLVVDGERVGLPGPVGSGNFKQTVVRRYAGILARPGVRRLVNAAAPVGGWPCCRRWTPTSTTATPATWPWTTTTRGVRRAAPAIYNAARERGCSYFMLGLSEAKPPRCGGVMRAYRHLAYPSRFTWSFGGWAGAVEQVDGRVPAPECGGPMITALVDRLIDWPERGHRAATLAYPFVSSKTGYDNPRCATCGRPTNCTTIDGADQHPEVLARRDAVCSRPVVQVRRSTAATRSAGVAPIPTRSTTAAPHHAPTSYLARCDRVRVRAQLAGIRSDGANRA